MDPVAAAPWVLGASVVGLVILGDLDRYLTARRNRLPEEPPVPTRSERETQATPFRDRPALGKVRAETRSAAGAVIDALDATDRAAARRYADAERTLGDPHDDPVPDERTLSDLPAPATRVAVGDTAHAIHLDPDDVSTLVETGTLTPGPGSALLLFCGAITTGPITTRETGLPFCAACTTALHEEPSP